RRCTSGSSATQVGSPNAATSSVAPGTSCPASATPYPRSSLSQRPAMRRRYKRRRTQHRSRVLSSGVGTLPTMPLPRSLFLVLAIALAVPAAPAANAAAATAEEKAPVADRKPMPKLKIKAVVRHLDHPWDVKTLPGGTLIFTQRDRATLSVFKHGHVKKVK